MQHIHPGHLELSDVPPSTFFPVLVMPAVSLIIAVYNKPHNLRLVLAACSRQSFKDFEVIVADDGSGEEVKNVIELAQQMYTYPTTHLWHEDKGWRKNRMLNNGIRASRGEHLVFIDGDCIPSEHFLLDHWNEREPKKVLLGRRVEASKRWSESLTMEKIVSGEFDRYGWADWIDGFKGHSLRVEDGIRIPSRLVRKILLRQVRGMLGSNFSVAKSDIVAINGFDEVYDGPGCGEDSDVQYRLSLAGVTGKSMRNLAIQYHIWHPLTKVSDPCWDRFEAVKKTSDPQCRIGLVDLT